MEKLYLVFVPARLGPGRNALVYIGPDLEAAKVAMQDNGRAYIYQSGQLHSYHILTLSGAKSAE